MAVDAKELERKRLELQGDVVFEDASEALMSKRSTRTYNDDMLLHIGDVFELPAPAEFKKSIFSRRMGKDSLGRDTYAHGMLVMKGTMTDNGKFENAIGYSLYTGILERNVIPYSDEMLRVKDASGNPAPNATSLGSAVALYASVPDTKGGLETLCTEAHYIQVTGLKLVQTLSFDRSGLRMVAIPKLDIVVKREAKESDEKTINGVFLKKDDIANAK